MSACMLAPRTFLFPSYQTTFLMSFCRRRILLCFLFGLKILPVFYLFIFLPVQVPDSSCSYPFCVRLQLQKWRLDFWTSAQSYYISLCFSIAGDTDCGLQSYSLSGFCDRHWTMEEILWKRGVPSDGVFRSSRYVLSTYVSVPI